MTTGRVRTRRAGVCGAQIFTLHHVILSISSRRRGAEGAEREGSNDLID
jgi:hypothetical protein